MYDNIGAKIKSLAKATFFVEAISAIIGGIIWITDTDVDNLGAWFLIILGPFVAWSSSWLLYGFGELIDKSCDMDDKLKNIAHLMAANKVTYNNIDCNVELIVEPIKEAKHQERQKILAEEHQKRQKILEEQQQNKIIEEQKKREEKNKITEEKVKAINYEALSSLDSFEFVDQSDLDDEFKEKIKELKYMEDSGQIAETACKVRINNLLLSESSEFVKQILKRV